MQAESCILRQVGRLFAGREALVFETGQILQMVDHLVHQNRLLRWGLAVLAVGKKDCPRLVVIDGN